MKRKNSFTIKLAIITLMLGLFSPSINIENIEASVKCSSSTSPSFKISFTLMQQAEARRYKRRGYRKAHRRNIRRAHRRANYRHHHRRRGHRRRNNNILGAVVGGAIIGAAINSSSRRDRDYHY